jgi:hypothetical protein
MSEPFQPPAYQDRNEAFAQSYSGPTASPGLQQQAQQDRQAPAAVRLSGSGNGMSASQSEATMGGMLGHAQNGSATDTYNNMKYRGNQD